MPVDLGTKLIFLDSFDHYSTSQILRKWTSTPVGALGAVVVDGRTNKGVSVGVWGLSKTIGTAEYHRLTMGAALNCPSYSGNIITFSNIISGLVASISHVGDGRLKFTIANGVSTPASTVVIALNEWYYIEFSCNVQVAPIGGGKVQIQYTMEARVNEETVLNDSPAAIVDESPLITDHDKFATFSLGGPPGGARSIYDDVYVTDSGYLGDIRVKVLYPNAVGDVTMWTPNGPGDNYTKVKEHPADDDVTFVYSGAADDIDLYQLDDIDPGFLGEIRGAQALWLVDKSDMGLAIIRGQWKSGGVVYDPLDGDFYPSALHYLYDIEAEQLSLFTGAPWTVEEINGLQLGIKRIL